MNKLKNELKNRCLPPLLSREEMIEIMDREVYGYLPSVEYEISTSEPEFVDTRYKCGTVEHTFVNMTITVNGKSHTFRVDRLLHKDEKKRPLVILNNFHQMKESRYFPIEEMSEYEANYLVMCYTDISTDDGDFSNGVAGLLLENGQDKDTTCGKIGIWAWTAMRVLDYGLTLDGIDKENIAIAGHSRLGKTALYTAMHDTRFKLAFSNAAGCAGDAISHGGSGLNKVGRNGGETISDIVSVFPFWFCKNYKKYTERNISDTFDQHYLVASIAPRYVIIGSCDLDLWADPESQQLCALASSEAWEKEGLCGLEDCQDYLEPNNGLINGRVGFFKIHSHHFLSRHSWHWFMKFLEKHKEKIK